MGGVRDRERKKAGGAAAAGAGRRRMSASERRRTILAAAAETFAEKGYEAASVGEIAAASGITKPVLYDHFRSKRDLFVELLEQTRDELVAIGAADMAEAEGVEDRIRAAVTSFFAFAEDHRAAVEVLLSVPKGEPSLAEASRRIQREATAALARLLISEPGLLAGEPDRERRLTLTMEFVKTGMHGLALLRFEDPGLDRELLVETIMDSAWLGLRP